MRPHITALFILLSVAAVVVQAPALLAQVPDSPPIFYDLPAATAPMETLMETDEPVAVMLQFAAPAAIEARNPSAVARLSARNEAAQDDLEEPLRALGAEVLFRTQIAYNGIAVSVDPTYIDDLRALPGVINVHVMTPKERSDRAVSFVGAPAVWSGLAGATGRGVRVGIIDTGIDYTHATFGGPGTPQAYRAINPTLAHSNVFPTSKVVGGYDFAGDGYDASGQAGTPIPAPNPNPLDCNGHGTHVAGTVAGLGVTAQGQTYVGPFNQFIDYDSFGVGPGMAPEALLYAIKIFGCEGSTALVTQAIEYALDPNGDGDPSDRLDVVTLALSALNGSATDPDVVAINNAVRAGMVVVTAVGDGGNTFYSVDSPAGAQRAIAVGASIDQARVEPGRSTDSLADFTARGPQRGNRAIKPDLVAPGLAISSAAAGSGNQALALDGTSMATAHVAGAAVLLRQLHPTWSPERIKAALMNTSLPTRTADGNINPPSLAGAGRLNLGSIESLDLLAYAADREQSVGIAFGAPWLPQSWTTTRTLVLDNTSAAPRMIRLDQGATVNEPGVTLRVPTTPILVPAQGRVEVPVRLTVNPAELDFSPDAATPLQQAGFARHYMAEHGGYVYVVGTYGARTRAIHAAETGPVTIILDEQVLSAALQPGAADSYQTTTTGTRQVVVQRDGQTLLDTTVRLPDERDYSLVLVGRSDALGIVLVDETPDQPPAANAALVHFVNAQLAGQERAVPLDVYIDSTLQVSNLGVGQTSAYLVIEPGIHTVFFFRAGAPPSPQSLVAWKAFIAAPGEALLVGAGEHPRGTQLRDADIPPTLEDVIEKNPIEMARWAQFCLNVQRELGRSCGSILRDLQNKEGWSFENWQRGFVVASPARTENTRFRLRVPFNVFPKAASNVRSISPLIEVAPGANTFAFDLRNNAIRRNGLVNGYGTPHTTLTSAFELTASSPEIPGASENVRAADIRFLGVSNNLAVTRNIAQTSIFFGTASYGHWSTPNDVQIRIFIDTNFDGRSDFLLVNTSLGEISGRGPDDVFISVLYRLLPDGRLQAANFSYWNTFVAPGAAPGIDAAPFNSSVVMQAANARLLGLNQNQTRFRYLVETRARDAGRFTQRVDRVPASGWLEYDLARTTLVPLNAGAPTLHLRPTFSGTNGSQVIGTVNPALLTQRGSQRLLLLHHHNPPSRQAEVVTLRYGPFVGQGVQSHLTSNQQVFLPILTSRP